MKLPVRVRRDERHHPGGDLVLVVEDYQDAREMYATYLQFSGYRVAEATNGLEAIEKAHELMPDIILMDLALPKMDGWEATRRLKLDARTRHIPIVALTGHALAGHAEGAREAGCDAFVTKPCLPDALVAESSGCWRDARGHRRAGESRQATHAQRSGVRASTAATNAARFPARDPTFSGTVETDNSRARRGRARSS